VRDHLAGIRSFDALVDRRQLPLLHGDLIPYRLLDDPGFWAIESDGKLGYLVVHRAGQADADGGGFAHVGTLFIR
jgi:hypothetical protein